MITSAQNAKIKYARALLNDKNERTTHQAFVIEGVRLAEECLQENLTPELILFSERLSDRGKALLEEIRTNTDAVFEVAENLLNRVSDTRTSQGILMVFQQPHLPLPENANFVLALDKISDPGNLGAILRSATACGVQAILVTPDSIDIFNPKVVRAGMGAHFKLPIHVMEIDEIRAFCKEKTDPPLKILVSDVLAGLICWESNLVPPLCLVIGSEAEGVSVPMSDLADGQIHIPMENHNESYNAAIAAGVLLYEIYRQRKTQ